MPIVGRAQLALATVGFAPVHLAHNATKDSLSIQLGLDVLDVVVTVQVAPTPTS